MSELAERVARVLAKARGCEHAFPCPFCHWSLEAEEESGCYAWAREIVEAMREPTEAMVASYDGPRGEAEYGLDKYHPDFVRAAWGALIDAALKERHPVQP